MKIGHEKLSKMGQKLTVGGGGSGSSASGGRGGAHTASHVGDQGLQVAGLQGLHKVIDKWIVQYNT